jgi:hypothetical protein
MFWNDPQLAPDITDEPDEIEVDPIETVDPTELDPGWLNFDPDSDPL